MARRDRRTLLGALGRHAVHPFPARMAPEIVCSLLDRTKGRLRVLDPMMGSGTVVALAQSRNHQAVGIDIDPLAALTARVWTSVVDADKVRRAAGLVLARARSVAREIKTADAYPRNADQSTKKFIDYWFDAKSRRQP
jgi:hypothetical protein